MHQQYGTLFRQITRRKSKVFKEGQHVLSNQITIVIQVSATMLNDLKWQSLQERSYVARTCLLHKTLNSLGKISIPAYTQVPITTQQRRYENQFINTRANTDTYLYSFSRTIKCWNLLPTDYRNLTKHKHVKARMWDAQGWVNDIYALMWYHPGDFGRNAQRGTR